MYIGVSCVLPVVARSDGGIGWRCSGCVYNDNKFESEFTRYGAGDVIGVEVNFGTHTVSFFKNGAKQGQFVINEKDRSTPQCPCTARTTKSLCDKEANDCVCGSQLVAFGMWFFIYNIMCSY